MSVSPQPVSSPAGILDSEGVLWRRLGQGEPAYGRKVLERDGERYVHSGAGPEDPALLYLFGVIVVIAAMIAGVLALFG